MTYKIMKMKMFATLDKAKPHTENIRGFNLAVDTCTIVQVSRLPWQRKLPAAIVNDRLAFSSEWAFISTNPKLTVIKTDLGT
jgi:hypothetical protein